MTEKTVKYAGVSIVNGIAVHFNTTNSTDGKIQILLDLPQEEDVPYDTQIVLFKLPDGTSKQQARQHVVDNIQGLIPDYSLQSVKQHLLSQVNNTVSAAEAKKAGIEALKNL